MRRRDTGISQHLGYINNGNQERESGTGTGPIYRLTGPVPVSALPVSALFSAEMPDQIPKRVKSDRSRRLAAIESELRHQYFHSLLGRRLRVLVESSATDHVTGTACRYAPVAMNNAEVAPGTLIDVTAIQAENDRVVGSPRMAARTHG